MSSVITDIFVTFVYVICSISVLAIQHSGSDRPASPYNINVTNIHGTWVTLVWQSRSATISSRTPADKERRIPFVVTEFDIVVTTVIPGHGVFKVVRGVDGRQRQCLVNGLIENTQYTLYMVAFDNNGLSSNSSQVVTFNTTEDFLYKTTYHASPLQAGELLLLFCVILAWFIAVVVFLKRWDSIRILQPIEPRYRHSPKNLENVIIVKKPQDSVIYKNYSRKLSVTLIEREKRRLQRMNTMPALPIHEKVTLEDI